MCQMDALTKHLSETKFYNPEEPSPSSDDGVVLASKPAKGPSTPPLTESAKKKRVHRAAKLKQCKMDARREQWLAQVSGKVNKLDSCASSRSSQDDRDDKELLLHSSPCEVYIGTSDKKEVFEDSKLTLNGPIGGLWPDEQCGRADHKKDHPDGGSFLGGNASSLSSSEIGSCKVGVPTGDKGAGLDGCEMRRYDAQGHRSMCPSDMSTSHSNSSQVSSDEENEVDDWEAMADALDVRVVALQDAKTVQSGSRESPQKGPSYPKSLTLTIDKCIRKPESKYLPGHCGSRNCADACRAWRPDDVLRPQTLPRLAKQLSFPLQPGPPSWTPSRGSVWGPSPPPPPSHCPICIEELDLTDSSFLPCSCGFRLCLFCHHKILLGDGRCPGCRKSYNTDMATKLSRTVSARPRI